MKIAAENPKCCTRVSGSEHFVQHFGFSEEVSAIERVTQFLRTFPLIKPHQSPRHVDLFRSVTHIGFDDIHVADDDHEVVLSRHVMPFA